MVNNLLKYAYFKLGWKTDRKLIVFLSDDWGTTRVPSHYVKEELIKKGVNMNSNRFNQFDSLETNNDLEGLFNVLLSHKDTKGNNPVITAMTNVANPDFEKIREANFQSYFYEPFTKTLERNKASNNVYNYYLKGIKQNIFVPQYHGREHLQINRWLRALRDGHKIAHIGFNYEFYGFDKEQLMLEFGGEFSEAYSTDHSSDSSVFYEAIKSGILLFKELFNYAPIFFTPPSMYLPKTIDKELMHLSIQALDTEKIRSVPFVNGRFKRSLHYLGQKKSDGLLYLQRNAVFETNLGTNPVDACLSDIQNAFKFNKPAIISNHRASFTGSIHQKNRTQGLKELDKLFFKILKKWPDAEFISMNELIKIIKKT